MSFHVVLPSNSSLDLFPDNTLANFRVRLPKPITLQKPYEVGLEEIAYPLPFFSFEKNETNVIIRKLKSDDEESTVEVGRHEATLDVSSDEGLTAIQRSFNRNVEEYGFEMQKYTTHFNILSAYDLELEEGEQYEITLHPKLAYALGFSKETGSQPLKLYQDTFAEFSSPLMFENKQMFVYANVVEHQIVGDTLAPLLRICIPSPILKGEYTSEKYIRPYYLPVALQRIEEIHVQIRTHTGNLFPFPSGAPLICKLHFRPRK